MKKILTLILIFSFFCLPSYALSKKQKKLIEGRGYMGTLPEISRYFEYKIKDAESPVDSSLYVEDVDKVDFMQGPMDDSVFLDVIIKKETPSKYIDDIMDIIPVLTAFRTSIVQGGDIQSFNANVNTLDLYVTKLEKDYSDNSVSLSQSYNMLQEVSYKAKVLGNLKYEANYWSKYQPIVKPQYKPQYLKAQDDALLKQIDKTIFVLKTEADKAQYKN
jgi:hypothetical protein